MAIKIIKRPSTEIPVFDFGALDANGEALGWMKIPLNDWLADTCIETVWLKAEAILDITAWVEESLKILPVREVGGFLLGASGQLPSEKEKYQVAIERFHASTEVDFSSPNRLGFGDVALVRLDEERTRFLELRLVGWFHTHPGHTPYLSSVDMGIHEGFFTKKEDLAIVLDPLTERFDTGIFSRKQDGRPNNKADFPAWADWKALAAWAETKRT